MLQKEVVACMVATPSTSEYGRLSRNATKLLRNGAALYHPTRSFSSCTKRLSLPLSGWSHLNNLVIDPGREKLFASVVAASFSQRRKTIRNTLHDYLGPEDFKKLKIESGLRAENLSMAQFVAIVNHLTQSI